MVEQKIGEKVIRLVRGDITDLEVDAFVYDITEDCQLGSGYGGAIISRGGKAIQDQLAAVGRCATGEAIVTSGGKLKAKSIIHVNGPKFCEPDARQKLAKAIGAVLARAEEKGLKTLALPPLGTGLYQVPLDMSANVLVAAVKEHLKNSSSLREVVFVALDSREYQPFAAQIQGGN